MTRAQLLFSVSADGAAPRPAPRRHVRLSVDVPVAVRVGVGGGASSLLRRCAAATAGAPPTGRAGRLSVPCHRGQLQRPALFPAAPAEQCYALLLLALVLYVPLLVLLLGSRHHAVVFRLPLVGHGATSSKQRDALPAMREGRTASGGHHLVSTSVATALGSATTGAAPSAVTEAASRPHPTRSPHGACAPRPCCPSLQPCCWRVKERRTTGASCAA